MKWPHQTMSERCSSCRITTESSKCISALDSVPLNVAFYDPNGELAFAYKDALEKIKEKITETTSSIEKAVNTAMTEELNTILIAKDSAAETLNG